MTDFASALDIPIFAAVGIMEMLWHFTADYALQGDIGRHSDLAIAKAAGWTGDPGKLVAALVETKWLDLSKAHRLLVHDWHDHCTDYAKKQIKRYGLTFYTEAENVQTIPDFFVPRARGIGSGSSEKPSVSQVEEGRNQNVQTIPENVQTIPDSTLQEISDAYDRHQKFANREPRDLIIQQVLSMNGTFDWDKFRSRHVLYCAHYDAFGWNFSTLTFLGWIRAGMPSAPPAPQQTKNGNTVRAPAIKPSVCSTCGAMPCVCLERLIAKEAAGV